MKQPIGYVIATVKMPLYEGDNYDRTLWNDFVYEEAALVPDWNGNMTLGVAKPNCKTLEARVEMVETVPA